MNEYTNSSQALDRQPVTMNGGPHHLGHLRQRVLGACFCDMVPGNGPRYGPAIYIKLDHFFPFKLYG
jgi:hypothetical protein